MNINLEQIPFKFPTLRDSIIESLNFIGIQDFSDFDLKREYFNNPKPGRHDARHLYRTMLASALIASRINEPRRGLLAFCGAFIHDLAQKRDGEGKWHGPNAAREKWGIFKNIWDKYNLSEDECSFVRAAVSHHSGGGNSGYKDDKIVNQILHDADALDRCRFRQHDRLDWNYLSLPILKCTDDKPSQELKDLIGKTEAICGYTKYVEAFLSFKDFISYIR